jgi:DNA mismatch endonuclease (patch repair protein)
MTDIMSPTRRSQVMSRIRSRNTTPERYLARLLGAAGLNFRRNDRRLKGCPDFTFPDSKLAVFVEGDFWHGWRFSVWKHKLSPFWRAKISSNRARDQRNVRCLRRQGWLVLRIWEHEVEEDLSSCIHRITSAAAMESVDWPKLNVALESLPPLKRRRRLPKA